jgi:hypothetical protein
LQTTAVLSTPRFSHEQLKYRTVDARTVGVVAPPSRPDAPNITDSLRRIAVVLLQHLHRSEKVARGLDPGLEGTPPPAKRRVVAAATSAASAAAAVAAAAARTTASASSISGTSATATAAVQHLTTDDGDSDDDAWDGAAELSLARLTGWADVADAARNVAAWLSSVVAAAAHASSPQADDAAVLEEGYAPPDGDFHAQLDERGDAVAFPAALMQSDDAAADAAAADYDAAVAADDFHEARYLKPEYTVITSPAMDAGSALFNPCPSSDVTVRRVRYAFALPASADIYAFMYELFSCAKLTAESTIVSLIYIERLLETGRVTLRACNWRPIVLTAVLLASKVWDDLGSWAVEFAAVYPAYSVPAIKAMERTFCAALSFNLYIAGSTFAKYYFALRSLGEQRSFRQRYMNTIVTSGAAAAGAATGGASGGAGGGGGGIAIAGGGGRASGHGAPAAGLGGGAVAKRIEEGTKELRSQLYSRSL